MIPILEKHVTMETMYPQMISSNIMSDLSDFSVPWKSDVDEGLINQTFLDMGYYSHSANKLISPIVWGVSGSEFSDYEVNVVPLTEVQRMQLAGIVYTIFSRKWLKLWELLSLEYNPISNYDMTETETIEINDVTTGTDTGTKTIVNDGESTQTGTVTDAGSSTTDNGIFGFNSSTAKEADTAETTANNTRTDNLQATNDNTETETRNLANSNTTQRTDTRTLSRSGNIGVTTSQQMIQSELELWQWNFFKSVFDDIDSICCLDVY